MEKSAPVQSRLALIKQRLLWLEDQLETRKSADSSPWPGPNLDSLKPLASNNHPGERQLERMERQTEILRRQLKSLRESNVATGFAANLTYATGNLGGYPACENPGFRWLAATIRG